MAYQVGPLAALNYNGALAPQQQQPQNQNAWVAELIKAITGQTQQQPRQTFADARDALRPFRPDMSGFDQQAKESDQIAEHNKAWALKFPTAVQRAQREAEYFGIPVERTNTGEENRLRAMTPQQRVSERLGFKDGQTPEERRAILANQASLATGKPLSQYLPSEPRVIENLDGTRHVFTPEGDRVGSSRPGTHVASGEFSSGTIDGKPAKDVLRPWSDEPAPLPFDQKAWEAANPAISAQIRAETPGVDPYADNNPQVMAGKAKILKAQNDALMPRRNIFQSLARTIKGNRR